jgi:hypothetical protein
MQLSHAHVMNPYQADTGADRPRPQIPTIYEGVEK